jgi:hypothetical protein
MRVRVVARRSILVLGGVVWSVGWGELEDECGRLDVWRVRGLLQGYVLSALSRNTVWESRYIGKAR